MPLIHRNQLPESVIFLSQFTRALELFDSDLTALMKRAFNTARWQLLLSLQNKLEEEMVGIWFWNSVYLRTNKTLQSFSFAYWNTYFSEKYPSHQIMEFEKAIFIPTLEQNSHFKSERE